MAYTPRTIKDRVAVGDDIFLVEDLGANKIRLTPTPTHVSEAGTPVNKALLQPIEDELGNLSTTKVDKVSGKGLSTNDFTNALKNKLDGIEAGAQVNRAISSQAQAQAGTDNSTVMTPLRVKEAISNKVDKVPGKGLSTNDFTTALLNKLNGAVPYDGRIFTLSGSRGGTQLEITSGTSFPIQVKVINLLPGENLYLKNVEIYQGRNSRGSFRLTANTFPNPIGGGTISSDTFASARYRKDEYSGNGYLMWSNASYRDVLVSFELTEIVEGSSQYGIDHDGYWNLILVAK